MITTLAPVNLAQLEDEMRTASVDVGNGLAMVDERIYRNVGGTPGVGGAPSEPADFEDEAAAQTVLDAHVAMRNKTDAEYSSEFQNPATTPERKQEIRDITAGLLPREQVAISQAEWDQARGVGVGAT